tara:strand:- start:282 stop:1331 length:1050 start_codon:yes stop_codon:yes gene_type:complete
MDSKIEEDVKLDFSSVLIKPKPSNLNSRSLVSLERTITHFKYSPVVWSGTPIISANMDTTGTFEVCECLSQYKIITALHKFYSVEDYKEFNKKNIDPNHFMVSTGINDNAIEKLTSIFQVICCNWICIDIANGYISNLVTFCQKVRETFPEKIIVAGNVVCPELVKKLLVDGKVDVVKVGIGPGSACTTRIKTGVGMPQLSAVLECSRKAQSLKGHIISDGGITCPGDMAKAFGGGADFVMVGGQFAGHDQNPGSVQDIDGRKFKFFHGMSSDKAQVTHYGKMEKYRSSEGRVLKIAYKGDLNNTVLDYLGGLRSTCTYINAPTIEDMERCTTFVKVQHQYNSVFIQSN